MSKLKMVETVEDTVPLYEVPEAVSGEAELTGMIRCGYWYLPLDKVVGQWLLDPTVSVGTLEPELEAELAELARTLVRVDG